jgi:pimeloyl-ACP methyl ester carboxylesterase
LAGLQRLGPLPRVATLRTRAGRIAYALSGRGPASLLLLNGAGVPLDGWRGLYPAIERWGRVLAWNRPGLPGSDAPRQRQGGARVVATLRELLAATRLPPPYVLVGHSLGGLYAQVFARLHPDEVAGVLFLEATHPADRTLLKQHETQLVRALGNVLSLPQQAFRANVHAELLGVEDTVRELDSAGPFPPVPVRVVTGGKSPPGWLMSPAAVGARRANQQALARLSPLGEQVIAQRSGHFPQLTEPGVVLNVLQEILALHGTSPSAARAGSAQPPGSVPLVRAAG